MDISPIDYSSKCLRLLVAAIGLLVSLPLAAGAQGIPVIDTTAIAKHLQQIGELQKQLEEAKKIYDTANQLKESLNGITDVKDLASLLNNRDFQQYLPKEYSQYSGAVNDLIKGNANDLSRKYDYYNSGNHSAANDYYNQELKRQKGETYQDMAVGQAIYDQASKRAQGLNELKDKLRWAPTPKEVLDLQARISAESALLQNDIYQVQGLAMIQEARSRVDRQRNIERKNQLIDEIKNTAQAR